jgi:chromosome segregation ATPase
VSASSAIELSTRSAIANNDNAILCVSRALQDITDTKGNDWIKLSRRYYSVSSAKNYLLLRESVLLRQEKLRSDTLLSTEHRLQVESLESAVLGYTAESESIRNTIKSTSLELSRAERKLREVEVALHGCRSEKVALGAALAGLAEASHSTDMLRCAQEFVRSRDAGGVVDLLCGVIRPSSLATTALLSVLGTSLTTTLLVHTRPDAVVIGDVLRRSRNTGIITLAILEEQHQGVELPPQKGRLSRLADHATVLRPEADRLVTNRLQNWLLFEGSAEDALKLRVSSNIVTVDGVKLFVDGEILSFEGYASGWPGGGDTVELSPAATVKRLSILDDTIAALISDQNILTSFSSSASTSLAASRDQLATIDRKRTDSAAVLAKLSFTSLVPVDLSALNADMVILRELEEDRDSQIAIITKEVCSIAGDPAAVATTMLESTYALLEQLETLQRSRVALARDLSRVESETKNAIRRQATAEQRDAALLLRYQTLSASIKSGKDHIEAHEAHFTEAQLSAENIGIQLSELLATRAAVGCVFSHLN